MASDRHEVNAVPTRLRKAIAVLSDPLPNLVYSLSPPKFKKAVLQPSATVNSVLYLFQLLFQLIVVFVFAHPLGNDNPPHVYTRTSRWRAFPTSITGSN